MQATATIYVERGEDEIELTIEGRVSPLVRGRFMGPAEDCYPDEGGEAEVTAVLAGGLAWDGTLTADEERAAEDALRESVDEDDGGSDCFDDYDSSAAEWDR